MRSTARLATRLDTSDSAYLRAPRGTSGRILAAIGNLPRTVDELMNDLDLGHSTCSAGVNKLMRDGLVEDRGIRSVTRSGRTAVVWFKCEIVKPIRTSRPTRTELEKRIIRAVNRIERNAAPSDVIAILKGVHP